MPSQIVCTVHEDSQIGAARRQGQALASDCKFGDSDAARVGLAVTELATNLVRHGGGGTLVLQQIDCVGHPAIEVLSIDSGPGMNDVAACLRDGFSSGGTSGSGLGAVKRLATEFDIYSQPGKGTIVMARIQPKGDYPTGGWRWGAITLPAPGETEIGDCWRMRTSGSELSLMVADGLGHGPLAAQASAAAATVFEEAPFGQAKNFLTRAHQVMRSTRGAAIAMATASLATTTLSYAGVGNISGFLLSPDGSSRGLISHNGTVGAEMRSVQEFSYEWQMQDRLVMHSDGLVTRWNLSPYPQLLDRHAAVIAAVLLRDFRRGKDDATIVVLERIG